jgi:hypothetical protein
MPRLRVITSGAPEKFAPQVEFLSENHKGTDPLYKYHMEVLPLLKVAFPPTHFRFLVFGFFSKFFFVTPINTHPYRVVPNDLVITDRCRSLVYRPISDPSSQSFPSMYDAIIFPVPFGKSGTCLLTIHGGCALLVQEGREGYHGSRRIILGPRQIMAITLEDDQKDTKRLTHHLASKFDKNIKSLIFLGYFNWRG